MVRYCLWRFTEQKEASAHAVVHSAFFLLELNGCLRTHRLWLRVLARTLSPWLQFCSDFGLMLKGYPDERQKMCQLQFGVRLPECCGLERLRPEKLSTRSSMVANYLAPGSCCLRKSPDFWRYPLARLAECRGFMLWNAGCREGARRLAGAFTQAWPGFFALLAGNRLSARNIALMPRIAWRMRSWFSIRAKRTWSSP
ncbi:hypothetical protein D9M69_399740 [compost metagenome]